MKKIPNIWNLNIIFYSILSILVLGASFLVVNKDDWGIGSNIIFISSIITLVTAAVTPLFSMKIFNYNSYKIKMYSLLVGVIIGIIASILFWNNNSFMLELVEYSKNGLLWGLNIALLLISLVIMEVENNEEKIKNIANEIIEIKRESEEKDKKIIELQELYIKERNQGRSNSNE